MADPTRRRLPFRPTGEQRQIIDVLLKGWDAAAPTLTAIRAALPFGPAAVLRLVEAERTMVAIDELDTLLRRLWLEGAYDAAGMMVDAGIRKAETDAARLDLNLTMNHPRAAEFAAQRGAALVAAGADPYAIRAVVAEAIRDGVPVHAAARRIRATVGLHDRYARAVANLDKSLIVDGVGEIERARRVGAYADRLTRVRAETIARTETIRAHNAGRRGGFRAAAEQGLVDTSIAGLEWRVGPVSLQGRAPCDICEPLDGVIVGFEGQWSPVSPRVTMPDVPLPQVDYPPAHPNCFIAGTVVSGPEVVGGSAREYDGEIVEIVTAAGRNLVATPNHPILTPQGWIPVGLLRKGDHVLGSTDRQGEPTLVDVDEHQAPACIEDLADPTFDPGRITRATVPVAAADFHGDGSGSHVAQVWSDRQREDQTTCPGVEQHRSELAVMARNVVPDGGVRQRAGDAGRSTVGLAPSRVLGGCDVGGTLGGRPLVLFDPVRFSDAADVDVRFSEDARDDGTGDVVSAGKVRDRLAGKVALDQVVEVRRRPWSGHVYSIETVEGWHSAEGLIVSNCRCSLVLVPDAFAGSTPYALSPVQGPNPPGLT